MLKLFNRKKKDNKGFTLVELVVVIAILAILVGLLAPQYTKYVEKSRKSADASNMDELVKAVQVYAVDNAVTSTEANNTTTVTIQLTADGVKGAVGTNNTPSNLKDSDIAVKAFEAYMPNWKNVKLKSKKWGGNPTITLTIDAEGGVKTTNVAPDDFKKFYGGVDTTVDTTTNTNP